MGTPQPGIEIGFKNSEDLIKMTKSISLPTIIHFGCGQLGIGAVLPFLISRYGNSHIIIAVQRRSEDWGKIPNNIILPIRTKAGDSMSFRTVVCDDSADCLEHIESCLINNRRLLLLVSDIQKCHDLMVHIYGLTKTDPIVSCSLGSGQNDLIQFLCTFPHWKKVFLFENSEANDWKEKIKPIPGKEYFHILVDRICWHLEFEGSEYKKKLVYCHCEDPNKVSFLWPQNANIPELDKKVESPYGERILYDNWNAKGFSTDDDEIKWQHLRKRALINAPHAIAALFCYRLLAIRKMDPDKQYLAPLQEMLRAEHPEWDIAIDHYLRLRAIEVAYKRQGLDAKDIDIERLHADYCDAYQIASTARERFFATNDRLERLMSRKNLAKELEKFDEHILKPINFYDQKHKELTDKWRYGRPNDIDIICLRDFLTESFLEATRWLAK
jgi:hypothetical protein